MGVPDSHISQNSQIWNTIKYGLTTRYRGRRPEWRQSRSFHLVVVGTTAQVLQYHSRTNDAPREWVCRGTPLHVRQGAPPTVEAFPQ